MTPDELALWHEQAARVRSLFDRRAATDPCADCTVAFSDEMRAQGRCNGTPGVTAPPIDLTKRRAETRRESNRRCQARWRERHKDEINERRRAYFAAYMRKRRSMDDDATGTLG